MISTLNQAVNLFKTGMISSKEYKKELEKFLFMNDNDREVKFIFDELKRV